MIIVQFVGPMRPYGAPKTKTQYLRDHDPKRRGVRVIKHGNEYYIYREVK